MLYDLMILGRKFRAFVPLILHEKQDRPLRMLQEQFRIVVDAHIGSVLVKVHVGTVLGKARVDIEPVKEHIGIVLVKVHIHNV